MILARFLYNLASGILRFVGAIAIFIAILSGLFGLLDLIGLGLLAAFPDLIGNTTGSPMGDRICATMMVFSVLGILGLGTAAGWSISTWIRRCWVAARPTPITYRYFKEIDDIGVWRVDPEGVVEFRGSNRRWRPAANTVHFLTNNLLFTEDTRP